MVTIPELVVPATGTGLAEQRRAERYAAEGNHQMAAAYFRLASQMATKGGRDSAAHRLYLKYKAQRRELLKQEWRAAGAVTTKGSGR